MVSRKQVSVSHRTGFSFIKSSPVFGLAWKRTRLGEGELVPGQAGSLPVVVKTSSSPGRKSPGRPIPSPRPQIARPANSQSRPIWRSGQARPRPLDPVPVAWKPVLVLLGTSFSFLKTSLVSLKTVLVLRKTSFSSPHSSCSCLQNQFQFPESQFQFMCLGLRPELKGIPSACLPHIHFEARM